MNKSLILAIVAVIPWLVILLHAFFKYKPKQREMRRHLLFAFGSVSLGLLCGIPGHAFINIFLFKLLDSLVVFGIFWFFLFLLDLVPHFIPWLRRELLTKICLSHLFLTWLLILLSRPEFRFSRYAVGDAIYMRSGTGGLAILIFSFCYWGLITYWFFNVSRFIKEAKEKRSFHWMGIAGLFALLALFLAMIKTFIPHGILLFHLLAISFTGISGIIFYLGARFPFVLQTMEEKGQLLKLREAFLSHEEIKKKLHLFTTSFEQSMEGVAIADLKGNIVFANDSWLKAHGLTEMEVIDKNLSVFHTKEQLEKEVIPFNKRLMKKGQESGEVGHCRKGGTTFPAFMTSTLIKSNGKPFALLGTMVDITDRKRLQEKEKEATAAKMAAEALRKSKEFSENLIESMQDAFSVLDSSGVHINVNNALCHMTGFSKEELIGSGAPHLYWPPEEYPVIQRAFEKTLRGEFEAFELIFMRKNGERFPVIISPSWLKSDRGEVISYFATIKDISDCKRVEDELREQKMALEQKNLALKEIIEHIERTKNKVKEDIAINVDETILPILKKLKIGGVSSKYVNLLQHHLKELVSSFGRKITEKTIKLTPREIEICNMLKGGLTSKELSRLLGVSHQTIERHRKNIRSKLGISNKNVNLTSFLQKL